MKKSVVIAFGRFNPPTTGHALLIDFIKREAAKRKADAIIFPSQSHDVVTMRTRVAPRNPLPFLEKVDFLEEMFPGVTFNDNPRIVTAINAIEACVAEGYKRLWVVCGSDRAPNFQALSAYVKPRGEIALDEYGVIVAGNRDPDEEGVAGMSASKMRQAALNNDFEAFRKGVPSKRWDIAQRLFQAVQKHMGLHEAVQHAFLIHGPADAGLMEAVHEFTTMRELTPRDITIDSPRFKSLRESRLPFAIDVTNESYSTIRDIHSLLEAAKIVPTIYVHQGRGRVVAEDMLTRLSTVGFIKRGLRRDVVEVATRGVMMKHMIGVMEQAGKTEVGVKGPSEVDRLKATQKQQDLLTKQRHAQELLQAKQRELAKKTRDDMNKIKTGEKPTASPTK